MTAGYHYEAAPGFTAEEALNPDNYSNGGSWTSAYEVNPEYSAWWPASPATAIGILGSYYINTNGSNTAQDAGQNYQVDSWRLFKEEFTIPVNAISISGTLYMACDSAAVAYLDDAGNEIDMMPGPVYTVSGYGTDLHKVSEV